MQKLLLSLSFIWLLNITSFAECTSRGILDYSQLREVSRKEKGMNKGGVYKGPKGGTWFVKDYTNATQSNADEFLGGKLMRMVLGKEIADVRLVKGEGELVASKLLDGFVPVIKADLDGKDVLGEEKLVVAMDWLGLEDRHGGNQGFIIQGDDAVASRVDYDSVFEFDEKDPTRMFIKLSQMSNPDFSKIEEVIHSILAVEDTKIADVFASAVCQLKEVNSRVDIEKQKKRCDILLNRRKSLKKILEVVDWIKNGLDALEKEDEGRILVGCLNETEMQDRVKRVFGKSFVHIVFVHGDKKMTRYLKDKMNEDVDIRDEYGRTPLFDLVRHGRYEEAKRLIDLGADVNARDNSQRTPLFEAAEYSDVSMVSRLVKWGADVNALSDKHKTPLFYAAEYGRYAVVAYLLGLKTVDFNIQDVKGKTALFDASRNGRKDMVDLLISHGINVHIKDENGRTAKYYAAEHGHADVVEALENAGAEGEYELRNNRPQESPWGFWNIWNTYTHTEL